MVRRRPIAGSSGQRQLGSTQTIEADWPRLQRALNGQPVRTQVHQKVINLKVMGVVIDLQRREVAKVSFVTDDGVYNGPPLTDAQKQQALEIVRANSMFQEIQRHGSFEIEAEAPWFNGYRTLGAVAEVRLNPPQTIEADWPALDLGPDGQQVQTQVHHKVLNSRAYGHRGRFSEATDC